MRFDQCGFRAHLAQLLSGRVREERMRKEREGELPGPEVGDCGVRRHRPPDERDRFLQLELVRPESLKSIVDGMC